MSLEYCSICDEPTGRAGRSDDSIVCHECDRVICEDCQVDGLNEIVLCKECASKIIMK